MLAQDNGTSTLHAVYFAVGVSLGDAVIIMAIAKEHELVVVEDCPHAHGAHYKN